MTDEAQSLWDRKRAGSAVVIALAAAVFLYFAFPLLLAMIARALINQGVPDHYLDPILAPIQWLYDNSQLYEAYIDWLYERLNGIFLAG